MFILNRDLCNWVKFVAAILVAISHYSTVIVINNNWSDCELLRFFCQGGYIGVAIFFFLSGYGLMESESRQHLSFRSFLRKRFARVYIPVLLVTLVWIPLWCFFVADANWKIGPVDIIYYLFWDFRDPVLWFIKMLFFLYLIFYLYTLLRSQNRRISANLVLILGTLATTYCAMIMGYPYISIPLFALGVYSSVFKENFRGLTCYFMILLMAFVYSIWFLITRDSNPAHGLVNTLTLLVVLLFVRVLDKRNFTISLNSNQVSFLLNVTFAVYLVHFKVLDLMVANWGYISFISWLSVTIVITLITAYLIRLFRI